MADERFLIQIILDAQSKIAPVLNAAADEVEKFQTKVKGADSTVQTFDRHLVQLDGHVGKARDSLRSINPTLDAFDRKLKGASTTLTAVNRNFSTLERNSAKAGAALGGVATLVDRLEKKLAHLDARMTEMGARKYEAKMDVNTEKSELKIRELERDLERATRGVYTAKTDVEIGAAMAKAEALRQKLESIGRGDRATNIVIDVALRHEEETKAKIDAINRKANEAARPRIFQIAAETKSAERDISRLTAFAKTVDKQRVGLKASLQTGEFKAQYAEIIAEMRALGATRAQIKVVAKLDRNSIQQLGYELTKIGDKFGADLTPTYSQILSGLIRFAIYAINPLISTLAALGGAFIAVGSSALSAGAGIAGFAAAGAAQALPVVGLLVAAFSRLQAVMKAVTAAQMQKDKAAYQDTTIGRQQTNTAEAIKQAHQGVTDALRNLTYAQENLTNARQQGIRTIEDMILAEQRADLQNQRNSKALATAVASGQGSVIEAQLSSTSSGLDARRQTVDTRKAVAGGVDNLPSVVQARRAVDDATRGVDRANAALAAAGRNSDFAAGRISAADRTLGIALSHLDGAEKRLYGVIKRFQDLFMPGGALTHVVDPIINAFADGLDKIIALLTDPQVMQAATSLSTAIGAAISQAADFFTTGPMKAALLFFTQEAAQNLPVVEKIFEGLSKVFIAIAQAASGPFGAFLAQVADFFNSLGDNLNSAAGQNSLAKFFDTALSSLSAFWDLFKAFASLFGALMGPGGGVEEGNRAIEGLATRLNHAADYVRQHGAQVHQFLHESIDVMHGLFDVIIRVGAAFVRIFNAGAAEGFFKFLKNVIVPVFEDIVTTIGHIASVLGDVATWGPATTFMHLAADVAAAWIITANAIKVVGGIIRGLGTLGAVLRGGGIKSLFSGARGMTPVTPLFVEVVNQIPGVGPRGVPGGGVPEGTAAEGSALGRVLKFASRAAPWIIAADALINADSAGQTPTQERASLAAARKAGKGQGFQGGQYGTLQGLSGRQLADEAKANTQELEQERKKLDQINKLIGELSKKGIHIKGLDDQRYSLEKSIADWNKYSKAIDSILSGRLAQTLKETEGNFEGMRISTRAHLKDITKATHDNMSTIANELGTKSEAGKQALAQNFKDAADQIQQSMDDGLISAKTGMQKIEDLLDARLQLYGFTKAEAHRINQQTTVETNRGHAAGGWVSRASGWVGHAGERGRDMVRTVLGRGEAVLNWAQQRAVNAAMAGRDSLDGIFRRTNSMHAGMDGAGYAAGGFINNVGAHVDTPNERTIASDLARLGRSLGIWFSPAGPRSARRTPAENAQVDGAPGSHHLVGSAMDVAPDVIKTISNAILNRFGLNRPMASTWTSPTGQVHDERNHIELLAGAVQSAAGAVASAAAVTSAFHPLQHLKTAMPGLLGANVQGAMNLYRAAMNKVAHQAFDRSGGGGTSASAAGVPTRVMTGPDENALQNVPGVLRPYDHRYPLHHTGTSGAVLPADVVARIQAWAHLPLPGYISQRESSNMPGIVEWPPESDGAQGYGLWQLTTGHVDNPVVKMIHHLGGWIEMLNPLKNALVSSLLYRIGGPGRWATYGGGGYAWGGMQSEGGDYLVSHPTVFVAGDKGAEIASFRPMAKGGWPSLSGGPAYFSNQPAVLDIASLAGDAASLSLGQSAGAISKILARIRRIPTKTKDAVNLLAASMDALGDSTNGVIVSMLAAVDAGVSRAKTVIQRRLFGSGARRTHLGSSQQAIHVAQQLVGPGQSAGLVGAVSEARAGGASDMGILDQQRAGYLDAQKKNNALMVQAQRGLAAAQKAHNVKAEQVFKSQIAGAKSNAAKISASLSQNAQDMVERREQMQNDIFTATNSFFERQNAMTSRWQRVASALGLSGNNQGLFQQQIDGANSQISALQGQLAAAQSSGNTALAQQIQDKIADLDTSVVELTAQKLQDSIDQVNNDAARKLSGVALSNRLADVQERAGNAVGAARARGAALATTGNIITAQRNSLYGLLATAQQQGNQGEVEKLTDQIADLNVQIKENTQAISDNNVAIRQASIDEITRRASFRTGVFGGLGSLLGVMGQVSGTTDTAAQRRLFQSTGSALSTAGAGLRGQLLSGYGINTIGQTDAQLVNTLGRLDYNGIEAKFSQAQRDQFESLINSIIDNASAVNQNTLNIKALDSSLVQTFASSSWTRFRDAIFTGNNTLLPQYQIPSMDTGGDILSDGFIYAHAGEVVSKIANVNRTSSTSGGDTINVEVNEAGQPTDADHIARVISFSRSSRR